MRILIVEDEEKLADLIKMRLKKEKYIVDISLDGNEGLHNALYGKYDLILLDIMLPGIDGISILKKLKEKNVNTKIIMLTAKHLIEDKLTGFENGAEDYITKPFYMDELVARVNVCLRKNNSLDDYDKIKYGDIILDIKNAKLMCIKSNEEIELALKEFLILECLMRNINQYLSKEQLYDSVWGAYNEIESNNLEAYLSFIRKKLKLIESSVSIKTQRGIGYKLEVNDETVKK